MSDLLIKNTKNPNSCAGCYMFLNGTKIEGCLWAVCSVNQREIDNPFGVGKPDWCPLVEVPPHGRLGDLDKLEKMFADIDSAPYSCFDGTEPFYSAEDAAQIIRLAPTVIEAEEEQ